MSNQVEPIALRPGQAAKALGVDRSTLYRLEKRQLLKMDRPCAGITLITIKEINRFIKHRDAPGHETEDGSDCKQEP